MHSKIFLLVNLALVGHVAALPVGANGAVEARNEAGTALMYWYEDSAKKRNEARNEAGTALMYWYEDSAKKREEAGTALDEDKDKTKRNEAGTALMYWYEDSAKRDEAGTA